MGKTVVLAYSRGLDTSVAVKWLAEEVGLEDVAMAVDVGQGDDFSAIEDGAFKAGALTVEVIDTNDEFANESLRHGCAVKGNHQVRFELGARALDPSLEVIAPVRFWGFSRKDSIDYVRGSSIPITPRKKNPYSIDQNLWGRAIECGEMQGPWAPPSSDVYEMTIATKSDPQELVLLFDEGVLVAIDGVKLTVEAVIETLNSQSRYLDFIGLRWSKITALRLRAVKFASLRGAGFDYGTS